MCTKELASNVGLGAGAFGTAASTAGAYYAGREKQAGLRASADIEEINARMLEGSAQEAQRGGERRKQKSQLETAALKSTQKTNLAANGVDLGSNSAVALLTTTDIFGELDAQEIVRDALSQSWGYKAQAVSARSRAQLGRARAASISPTLEAIPTLLSGATDVSTSYYNSQRG